MTANGTPLILEGCSVLPAIQSPQKAVARHTRKESTLKGKPGSRFAVLNAFVDFTLRGLSRAEMAVWLILYRDTREGLARTAVSDIARRAGCNRGTVFRAIGELKWRGLLTVLRRGGLGRGSSRYRVHALDRDK
jgi:hypothetical protein